MVLVDCGNCCITGLSFAFVDAPGIPYQMSVKFFEICGGITAPQGFVATNAHCGIKEGNKKKPDIALIFSPAPAVAAATFTTNKVKAAPVKVSMAHLRSANVRAIVANSGNANACTGVAGI